MSQHFLLSAQARTLSVAKVARMSEEEARATFRALRWSDTQGEPLPPTPYAPRYGAFRGEMLRHVLGALRSATAPLTSLELATSVCEARGLDANDRRAVGLIRKRVGACLFKLTEKGLVREVPQKGQYKGWELVR